MLQISYDEEIIANTMLIFPALAESKRVFTQAKAKTNVGLFSLLTANSDRGHATQ